MSVGSNMKTLVLTIFLLIIMLNNSMVGAVGDVVMLPQEKEKISAEDELKSVKQSSLFAFYSTRDYADIVNNNLALVATSRVNDYKKVLDRITKVYESTKTENAKYCAWFAETIIAERLATLEAYIKFAECYSAGDSKGCKNYNSQIKYRSDRANELYKSFAKVFDI